MFRLLIDTCAIRLEPIARRRSLEMQVQRIRPLGVALSMLAMSMPSAAQDTITKVQKSPPYWSGDGAAFSPWYSISSDPGPDGYVLESAVFSMEGDRRSLRESHCGTQAKILVFASPSNTQPCASIAARMPRSVV